MLFVGQPRSWRVTLTRIRLEIPYNLQPSLKALEAVSFNLKKRFPNIRRNIKFDDAEKDLVLDFCTDPDDDEPWRKVRPAQAKALKKKLAKDAGGSVNVSDDELGQMLKIGSQYRKGRSKGTMK